MDSLQEPIKPYTTITKQDHFRSICDLTCDLDLAESKPSFPLPVGGAPQQLLPDHLGFVLAEGLITAHRRQGSLQGARSSLFKQQHPAAQRLPSPGRPSKVPRDAPRLEVCHQIGVSCAVDASAGLAP